MQKPREQHREVFHGHGVDDRARNFPARAGSYVVSRTLEFQTLSRDDKSEKNSLSLFTVNYQLQPFREKILQHRQKLRYRRFRRSLGYDVVPEFARFDPIRSGDLIVVIDSERESQHLGKRGIRKSDLAVYRSTEVGAIRSRRARHNVDRRGRFAGSRLING